MAGLAEAERVRWYLSDHLGTVRDLADAAGEVLDHIVYDSFGNVLAESNPAAGDRFRFTGREFDAATGQYYYRARYYDGTIGRFTSEDPLGLSAGDVNLYRYVSNRPTAASDPSGREPVPPPPGPPSRWTGPEYAAWYAQYMAYMGQIAAPVVPSSEPGFWYLYWYYLMPGHSAPADPWYLNWGSEFAGGVGIAAGLAAGGLALAGGGGAVAAEGTAGGAAAGASGLVGTEVVMATYPAELVTTEVAGAAFSSTMVSTEMAAAGEIAWGAGSFSASTLVAGRPEVAATTWAQDMIARVIKEIALTKETIDELWAAYLTLEASGRFKAASSALHAKEYMEQELARLQKWLAHLQTLEEYF